MLHGCSARKRNQLQRHSLKKAKLVVCKFVLYTRPLPIRLLSGSLVHPQLSVHPLLVHVLLNMSCLSAACWLPGAAAVTVAVAVGHPRSPTCKYCPCKTIYYHCFWAQRRLLHLPSSTAGAIAATATATAAAAAASRLNNPIERTSLGSS
jgi:hypothetical protein